MSAKHWVIYKLLPNDLEIILFVLMLWIVFIVVIVKTMFRFWPWSPYSLNQPSNKGLGLQPQCIYNFIRSGQGWEKVRSTAVPYFELSGQAWILYKVIGGGAQETFGCNLNSE